MVKKTGQNGIARAAADVAAAEIERANARADYIAIMAGIPLPDEATEGGSNE